MPSGANCWPEIGELLSDAWKTSEFNRETTMVRHARVFRA
jgi:hypothetical protein